MTGHHASVVLAGATSNAHNGAMAQAQLQYLPPQNWKDFQGMVEYMAKYDWPDAIIDAYGREGQTQDGIDVLVNQTGAAPIGIQAKKRRLMDAEGHLDLTGGLTTGQIDDMVKAAGEFDPPLQRLVIATTALSDKKLVDHAAKVTKRREKKGQFSVAIWFWDRFDGTIQWNSDLQEIYFKDVAPRLLAAEPKKSYLLLVGTAFCRLAFRLKLEMEDSGDDMIKALAGTRKAITVGVLEDREGRRIGRAPLGLMAIDGPARAPLTACVDLLDQTGVVFRSGLASGALVRHGNMVRPGPPPDGPRVVREVDQLRGQALEKVNEALATEGLTPLKNYLL